ncbi:MAG TPA: hypothetical protein PKH28_10770, partial [Candidatus Competibacteraceae bacterium]|nr:hypothetical protein [Candidatus Competibacteraceae bacterium]
AVVSFKRHVYWRALHELAPLLFVNGPARAPATPAVESSPGRVARKQAVVLPLRRLELGQHPVITRMVISARRTIVADDTLEVPVVAPPREEPPCPSTPRSHRLSRR